MAKSHPFDSLSNVFCSICDKKRIKTRKLDNGQSVCYSCFRKKERANGNPISTASEVRKNPVLRRKPKVLREVNN